MTLKIKFVIKVNKVKVQKKNPPKHFMAKFVINYFV